MSSKPSRQQGLSIPEKANRVLLCLLVALGVIGFRIWQLAVVEHEERVAAAERPQTRHEEESPDRATIRDRYNIPLAVNRIQYQAAVVYSGIRQVPSIQYERDEDGKKRKIFRRRQYIRELAELLAQELGRDAERIEDEIHAKAALYGSRPFIVKEDIDEATYYRLRALERHWPGLKAHQASRRWYPNGAVACGVLGYMGAINKAEYERALGQLRALRRYVRSWELGEAPPLPEGFYTAGEVRDELERLSRQAYGIHDYVGKAGVEGRYEAALRGLKGRRGYKANARGAFLHDLPGSEDSVPGDRLLLTISAELQEYAEQLLAKNEPMRDGRSMDRSTVSQSNRPLKQPWIKGGAVVAMDPSTGEVLALASYPRYDPNVFIRGGTAEERKKRQAQIARLFETEAYIGQLFDGQRPLQRETFNDAQGWGMDEQWVDWKVYVDKILPPENHIRRALSSMTLGKAFALQEAAAQIPGPPRYALEEGEDEALALRDLVGDEMSARDTVLLVDLCRMAAWREGFPPELRDLFVDLPIKEYRDDACAFFVVDDVVRDMCRELFRDLDFRAWRDEYGRDYIKEKRRQEQEKRTYTRPYLDYYDTEERRQFAAFWDLHRWDLLTAFLHGSSVSVTNLEPYLDTLHQWYRELLMGAHRAAEWRKAYEHVQAATGNLSASHAVAYLASMRRFDELDRPLLGWYPQLRNEKGRQLEKHLAAAFYPRYGYGFARSNAFRQATPQGSVFKVVVAYEALRQRQQRIDAGENIPLNPLEIVDSYTSKRSGGRVAAFLDGTPILRRYKGGRVPRTLRKNVGRIDLVKALEYSSNPYFALLTVDHFREPEDLNRVSAELSFGSKTGIDLPGEIAGKLPDDLDTNMTGLYSMSMGQHTLVVTPLQTATMLCALANNGKVFKPKIVKLSVDSGSTHTALKPGDVFEYQEALQTVGLDFPLFTAVAPRHATQRVIEEPTTVVREVEVAPEVQAMLFKGMDASYRHALEGSVLYRTYASDPEAVKTLRKLRGQIIGKSSTAERMEWIDLDAQNGANMYNNIWFSGMSFDEKTGEPELAVAVYLQFGGYGKEVAPVAAQVVQKWREVKAARENAH